MYVAQCIHKTEVGCLIALSTECGLLTPPEIGLSESEQQQIGPILNLLSNWNNFLKLKCEGLTMFPFP